MFRTVRAAGVAVVMLLVAGAALPTAASRAASLETSAADAIFSAPVPLISAATLPAASDQPDLSNDDRVTKDGTAPAMPLRALVDARPASALDDEGKCLAAAVYFEARGEPLAGQLAVAQVILNRVDSGRFAGSICGVIRQHGQFSFVQGGRISAPRPGNDWSTAQAVAAVALDAQTRSVVGEATYFHAARVAPGWGLRRVAAIGNHVFYR